MHTNLLKAAIAETSLCDVANEILDGGQSIILIFSHQAAEIIP